MHKKSLRDAKQNIFSFGLRLMQNQLCEKSTPGLHAPMKDKLYHLLGSIY